jgi:hypothetical protein
VDDLIGMGLEADCVVKFVSHPDLLFLCCYDERVVDFFIESIEGF